MIVLKEKTKDILKIVLCILLFLIAISGPIVAFVYQYHLQIAEFGKFYGGIHIYNTHDFWCFTIFAAMPIFILL